MSRNTLRPFRQGDLDSLCGLYAIVNGMRLSMSPHHPLAKGKVRRLFKRGMEYLEERDCIDIVRNGLSSEDWHALARHLFKYADEQDMASFKRGKRSIRTLPVNIGEAIEEIERALALGIPVAVELSKGLNHYSVVSHADADRWVLFDSLSYQWISKASLGFEESGARHVLGQRAIFFLLK